MQAAVIEYARNVLGYKNANTTEVDPKTDKPVIALMDEQMHITDMGGTMRLGAQKCDLVEGSIARAAYGEAHITERHRHRYEFNNDFKEVLTNAGLKATGINPESGLVEIVEVENHPFFVGVQYHPEYKSTVVKPHPLFVAFVKACDEFHQNKQDMENQNKGLDKNQIIGFVLIAAIMGVFGWWQSKNAPEEPLEPVVEEALESVNESDLVVLDETAVVSAEELDSNGFVAEEFVVENNDLKLTFSTQGARMISAQMKDYQTYDSLPLYLVNENQTMDLILLCQKERQPWKQYSRRTSGVSLMNYLIHQP